MVKKWHVVKKVHTAKKVTEPLF